MSAVKDICLCDIRIARLDKHNLDAVLYIFNPYEPVFYFILKLSGNAECKKVYDLRNIILFNCIKSLNYSHFDLCKIKINNVAVSFNYTIHSSTSFIEFLIE